MAGTLTPWPGLPVTVHARQAGVMPYPLDGRPDVTVHARARSGLAAGLRALGVGEGSVVLLPAWHHGSEVEATLSTGAHCRFYEVDDTGAPSKASLESLLCGDVVALHLTHLLGFPQDAAAWRRWCDDRGLRLVEDAAQAWTASRNDVPVGSHADLAVWCLYKTVGVPDGAAVRCDAPLDQPATGLRGLESLARRHAAWAAQALPIWAGRAPAPYEPQTDMAMLPAAATSAVTRWALPRIRYDDVRAARRRNFRAWAASVRPMAGFEALPDGAVPMVFPVCVDDKDAALTELRALGIRALDLWRWPHPSAPAGSFARVDWLRAHLIGMPVHQEIGERRMLRAVEAAAPVLRRRRCHDS